MLPTTPEELLAIKGTGPKKRALYGDDILAIVAPYASNGSGTGTGTGGAAQTSSFATTKSNSEQQVPVPTRARIDTDSLTDEQRDAAQVPLEQHQNVQ